MSQVKLAASPGRTLLRLALGNVHLLRAPTVSPMVLAAVAEVTGIPAAALADADSCMSRTGSLLPLRRLLKDKAVPKAEGLRYSLELRQAHAGPFSPAERIGQQLVLALESARGKVQVELAIVLQRRRIAVARERQMAHIGVTYRLDVGATRQAFTQEVTIAENRPARHGAPAAQAA